MGKQLQFELWQECNSHCLFCYNGRENRFTPKEKKINSLKNAIKTISDLSHYPEYDTLAYLGGEFFQGQLSDPEVKELFMDLMKKTAWLYENDYVKHVWIYVTLTIGAQEDLYETLKLFNKKDDLWILTSYDTIGRFHSQTMFDNWDYHMKHIHELYPEIKFNITSILTGDLCDKYIADELSFKDMKEKYHAEFFFKQCGKGSLTKQQMNKIIPNFFPTRKQFLKFLYKFRAEEDDMMWTKLFNIYYRADTLFRNFNDKGTVENTRHKDGGSEVEAPDSDEVMVNPNCGHMVSYQAYIDCDNCCICDKETVGDTMV